MKRELIYRYVIFAILLGLTLFFLPLLCTAQSQLLLLLVVYTPGTIFVLSWFFGLFCGFRWQFPLAAGLLFVPAALIYFNTTALWFALVYGLLAALGCFFGSLWRRGK